jgi:hydrogenase maturation factor
MRAQRNRCALKQAVCAPGSNKLAIVGNKNGYDVKRVYSVVVSKYADHVLRPVLML